MGWSGPSVRRRALGIVFAMLVAGPQGMSVQQGGAVNVTREAPQDTVVTATFAVAPAVVFDALTGPAHLKQWMRAAGMTLAEVDQDPRPGGSFRYVFQRPTGRRIAVLGTYRTFDPPHGFAYIETYDFSTLRIEVTTRLENGQGGTLYTQRLHYASAADRDEDFEPVASSSREALARLGAYLSSRTP